jgi:hypothetical protein
MTKSYQRVFFVHSLPVSRGALAARLRQRCPFGKSYNTPSISDFGSDSPLSLMSGLWLSLSCCWACGLVCSRGSDVTPLAVRCSNYVGLGGSTRLPPRIPSWLWGPPGPLRLLYLITCFQVRLEFVKPSVGRNSPPSSIIIHTRLTDDGTRWPWKCVSHEPAVARSGAVAFDPARHVLVSVLTSNQQSSGCV